MFTGLSSSCELEPCVKKCSFTLIIYNLVLVLSSRTTHQEPRGAVQETSDSGYKASVEKAGELWGDFSRLRRVEQAAHYEVLACNRAQKGRDLVEIEAF